MTPALLYSYILATALGLASAAALAGVLWLSWFAALGWIAKAGRVEPVTLSSGAGDANAMQRVAEEPIR